MGAKEKEDAMWKIIVLVGVLSLTGCATIYDAIGMGVMDHVEKAVGKICALNEADRLPIRADILERYGLDTSGVCEHIKNR